MLRIEAKVCNVEDYTHKIWWKDSQSNCTPLLKKGSMLLYLPTWAKGAFRKHFPQMMRRRNNFPYLNFYENYKIIFHTHVA